MLPEIKAMIRNLSPGVGAFDAQVHCDVSSFGIGLPRSRLATQIVSLAPAGEQTLVFPLTQELLNRNQFLGIHIVIEHPYDSEKINNAGSQTPHLLSTAELGRDIAVDFPVFNDASYSREFRLSVLSNGLTATVTPAVQVLAPAQQITAHLHIVLPANDPSPYHRLTVVAEDADRALIDGLTYQIQVND